MNKLIIAGNGFDLAHGLPTSYNDFMDAFWRDLKDDFEDEFVKEVVFVNKRHDNIFYYGKIESYQNFKGFLKKYTEDANYHYSELNHSVRYGNTDIFKFQNNFFKELNKTQSIQNWVDVENEYYQALKIICKDEKLEVRQKREEVLNLHKEFDQVKQLLERYLQKNVVEVYDFNFDDLWELRNTWEKIIESIRPENLTSYSMILNFNYTPTIKFHYQIGDRNLLDEDSTQTKICHIHGKLSEDIVFGFGDEMDEDYKLIEDIDDNEYLKYFKSFQYVQNSNYKDVLRHIDSEEFEVMVMGHSCGLSDRTLLNTIFEHDNCRSIKVFYHQKEDGTDDYTKIIQNISRHFNDKKLMRTKIVEKTLCEPMPQIKLPKK